MHVIYQTHHLFQAHLVKHVLEEADIPVFVLGESLIGGMGELPSVGLLRVAVPASAAAPAQALVARLRLDDAAAAPIWDDESLPGAQPV